MVGVKWEEGVQAREEVKVEKKVIKDADTLVKKDVTAEDTTGKKRAPIIATTNQLKEKIVYETITNTVYKSCSITDDSLHDLNTLISGTNSAIQGN